MACGFVETTMDPLVWTTMHSLSETTMDPLVESTLRSLKEPTWRKALAAEFWKPYFKELVQFVAEERDRQRVAVCHLAAVFTWVNACPREQLSQFVAGERERARVPLRPAAAVFTWVNACPDVQLARFIQAVKEVPPADEVFAFWSGCPVDQLSQFVAGERERARVAVCHSAAVFTWVNACPRQQLARFIEAVEKGVTVALPADEAADWFGTAQGVGEIVAVYPPAGKVLKWIDACPRDQLSEFIAFVKKGVTVAPPADEAADWLSWLVAAEGEEEIVSVYPPAAVFIWVNACPLDQLLQVVAVVRKGEEWTLPAEGVCDWAKRCPCEELSQFVADMREGVTVRPPDAVFNWVNACPLDQLSEFIAVVGKIVTVCPPADEVFTWANVCPLNQLSQFVADMREGVTVRPPDAVFNWVNACPLDQLSEFIAVVGKKVTVCPPADEVFTWANVCPLDQVKVVIVGQDPYHGVGQAHGLSFSVKYRVCPSLRNIYKTLEMEYEKNPNLFPGHKLFQHPGHGDLTGWAKQGVLLLNAVLTVRAHYAHSHKGKGWEKFTDAVIWTVNTTQRNVVFMLWGSYAQKKGSCIDKDKHHVLKASHPSPRSASRERIVKRGEEIEVIKSFFDCEHFSEANKYLMEKNKKPIDWTDLP